MSGQSAWGVAAVLRQSHDTRELSALKLVAAAMKNVCRTLLPVLALAIPLAACSPQRPSPQPDALTAPLPLADGQEVVARVDGVAITQSLLDAMARGRGLDLSDPAQRTRALDELVEYAVLVGAARRDDSIADAAARADVELNALAGRANAVMGRLGARNDPDDAALRAEYDQQNQVNGPHEYQVAHLLFAEEEPALAAAGAVLTGTPFAQVQAQYQGQARQAIDLGWVKLGQLPEEFAAALRDMTPGQTSTVPVQTPYGWHVIHLTAQREFTPPPFEQVREGIRRMLVSRAMRAEVDALKSRARIDITTP